MEKLFELIDKGPGRANKHIFLLCGSEREYFAQLSQSRKQESPLIEVSVGKIEHIPQHKVSGFSDVFQGRYFLANGFTVKYVSIKNHQDYSSFHHFIRPGTIEQNKVVNERGENLENIINNYHCFNF